MNTVDEYIENLYSPLGELQSAWSPQGLRSLSFLEKSTSKQPFKVNSVDPRCQQLQQELDRYFATGKLHWDLGILDWRGMTEFQQRALRACFAIPSGNTCSYAGLAAKIGSPKASRAVGAAMAKNRWPLLIPCHRVVGSKGNLVGYSGRGGVQTKKWLLEMECSRNLSNAS
jgi:methylated-DNA-[protein]-cysteine S-methyltransferase